MAKLLAFNVPTSEEDVIYLQAESIVLLAQAGDDRVAVRINGVSDKVFVKGNLKQVASRILQALGS